MENMTKPDAQAVSSPMPPVVNSPNPSSHGPFTAVGLSSSGQLMQSDPPGMGGGIARGRVSGMAHPSSLLL